MDVGGVNAAVEVVAKAQIMTELMDRDMENHVLDDPLSKRLVRFPLPIDAGAGARLSRVEGIVGIKSHDVGSTEEIRLVRVQLH